MSHEEEQALKTPYLRGYRQLALIRDLAEGKATQAALAEKYGVTGQAIYTFSKRNADRIRQVREDFENEVAGLWIANKTARIAEYQADADLCSELVEEDPASDKTTVLLKVKHGAMRSAAEELGQLKSTDGPMHVNVHLSGVEEDV